MSASARPIQEDELHGFVDGRLDAGRHAEIALLLQRDPALQQRVADWQAHRTMLQDAMAYKAREPVPPSLHLGRLIDARLARQAVPWRMAAGFVLCLALGAAGGWFARDREQSSDLGRLTQQAASAHRVFAADETRPTELGSADRAELVGWISQRLGHHVSAPDLTALGYHFLGGRLLAAMGGPAAMLMYDDAGGNRVTIYIQPMRRAAGTRMQQVESATGNADPVGGYVWINDKVGYSVMSQGAPPALHRLANEVRDEMRGPD
jgi:anti-sigma factor RsiW